MPRGITDSNLVYTVLYMILNECIRFFWHFNSCISSFIGSIKIDCFLRSLDKVYEY